MGNNIERNKIQGDSNKIIGEIYINNCNTYANDSNFENYCEPFIRNQIKKSGNLIKTAYVDEAIKHLETKNSIMLVGRSGIGKTCLSYAICNYFMENENYNFRFVSTPSESDLYKILNIISESEKEIIIIDDVFGISKLDVSDARILSLEKFIKNINGFENKKFIFTTRKTILRQVSSNCKAISTCIKNSLVEIDLDNYKDEDKLNIFVYYCKMNDLASGINDLIEAQSWNDTTLTNIIKHNNFTPLVIKFATEKCKNALPNDYLNIILSLLEHPEDVWEKEIKALDSFSLKYMNVLLSLSNSSKIKREIADECFKKYIETTKIEADFTFKQVHDNIAELINSDDDKYLYFVHPSLIEYLDNQITEKEREDIITSALYLEQIEKMDNTNDLGYIRKIMVIAEGQIPNIFKLKVMPVVINFNENPLEFINIIWTHYLKYLYKFKINCIDHQPIVIEVLKQILDLGQYIFMLHSDDIINTFSLNYDFSQILESDENLQILFSNANPLNIWYLLHATLEKSIDGYNYSKMKSFMKKSLEGNLIQIGAEQLDIGNIVDYVEAEMDNYDENETFYYDDIIDAVRERIYDDLDFCLAKTSIKDTLNKNLIYDFNVEEIDDSDIFVCFWNCQSIESEITGFLDKNYS